MHFERCTWQSVIKRGKRSRWYDRVAYTPRKIFEFRPSRSFLVPFWAKIARVGRSTAKSSHCV